MEERRLRKEAGLPEIYLYGSQTRSITYGDFINKELILFSNMDNERSIPCLVDGKFLFVKSYFTLDRFLQELPVEESLWPYFCPLVIGRGFMVKVEP